jgi:imidazolonepropionase-like amidohydrolase
MAAMVSANSVGAEALGLQERIGSIGPGLDADIIALDGDPSSSCGTAPFTLAASRSRKREKRR